MKCALVTIKLIQSKVISFEMHFMQCHLSCYTLIHVLINCHNDVIMMSLCGTETCTDGTSGSSDHGAAVHIRASQNT